MLARRFANPTDLPVCKMIKNEGVDKAKNFLAKLDQHEVPLKKLPDQFLTFILDAAKPDTKITITVYGS